MQQTASISLKVMTKLNQTAYIIWKEECFPMVLSLLSAQVKLSAPITLQRYGAQTVPLTTESQTATIDLGGDTFFVCMYV